MPNINICILAGNITRDIEIRYTPKGAAIAEFGLAINRKWRSNEGELKEEVSFFDCVCFGKTAEMVSEYFQKGSPVMLEGRLKQESWEDKTDGRKRSKIKVLVERVHFTTSKARPAGLPENVDAGSPAAEPAPAAEPDDVPF